MNVVAHLVTFDLVTLDATVTVKFPYFSNVNDHVRFISVNYYADASHTCFKDIEQKYFFIRTHSFLITFVIKANDSRSSFKNKMNK